MSSFDRNSTTFILQGSGPSDDDGTSSNCDIPQHFLFEEQFVLGPDQEDMLGSHLTITGPKRTASEASFDSSGAPGRKVAGWLRDSQQRSPSAAPALLAPTDSVVSSECDAVSGGDPSEGERSDTSHSREEPNPAIFPSVDAEEWAQTVQIVRYAVQSDIPSDQDKGIINTLYKAIIAADPAVPKSAEKIVLSPSRSVPLLRKQCIALTYDNYAGDKGKKDYKALCEVFDAKIQPGEIKTVAAP